jgi:DNA-binding NarL/FixJ family response regulator
MVSVLLVARTRVERDALAIALARSNDTEVVATAPCCDQAVRLAREVQPDVILLHQAPPEGLLTARALHRAGTAAKLVAVGVCRDEAELVAWSTCGIDACVDDEGSMEELIATVRAVADGEARFSPRLAALLFRRAGTSLTTGAPTMISPRSALTSREVEIVSLLSSGMSNKQIAQLLSLQLSTVKNHVQSIFKKLGINRRADIHAWNGALAPQAELA